MKQLFRERLRCARRLPLLPALLLACCLGGAASPAEAAGTYTVTSTLDDGRDGTLRSAIALADADPGATVVFAPGVSGVIGLQGAELDITASMTIIGPGADSVQVDGINTVRLLNITSPAAQVTVSGLTLQDGSAFGDPNPITNGVGGAILNSGTLALTGCTFHNNTASYGGGIYNAGALLLTGCTFMYDAAYGGAGGGLYDVGDSALTNCVCIGNYAFYGGAFYSGGTMALTACTVSANKAFATDDGNSGAGAGFYNDGALTLTACAVTDNSAYGGTADNGGPGGTGAGLYSDGTLIMTGCTVSGNDSGPNADSSGGQGGGLDNQGAATLTDDIFYADVAGISFYISLAGYNAEIYNDTVTSPAATVTASYCDIQGSSANPVNFGLNLLGSTNLDADPLFVLPVGSPQSPIYGDLHLQAGSPCIGQGIADPTDATDRDGRPRADPPSIGAYESAPGQTPGVWTPLAGRAPEPISTMLLLTDGTVMGQGVYTSGPAVGNGDDDWFKLTPDAHGSYANGTWTPMAPMHSPRTYYASTVLRDGRVLVAGGEYTDSSAAVNTNATEVYDPVADAWTQIAGPPGWTSIGAAPVKTLFDGTVLLGSIFSPHTAIYDETTGAWTAAADGPNASDEETWALLPDQTVLASINNPYAVKYLPTENAWVFAGQTPVDLVQDNFDGVGSGQIGPGVLLPGGQCFYIGGTGHTALYTMPSDPTQTGTWQAGPDFPADTNGRQLEAKDAPACLMTSGKVLCVVAPHGDGGDYPGPQYFFEYAYDAGGGTLTEISGPGINPSAPARTGRMLALPSGEVLYSNLDAQLAVYTPSGGPNPAWKPVISGGSVNSDGSCQVFGTQFNGLSEGASYGAGAAMSTNYPLVRVTDSSGVVTYARTYNHSTMGLATGSLPVSTYFVAPTIGVYQLQVVANGIASNPVNFIAPALLTSLTVPSPVSGGTVVTATVSINGVTTVNTVVGLSSSDSSVVRLRRGVIIPAGSSSATFTLNTYRSHVTKTVTIQATLGPAVQTANLIITGR